MGWTPKTAEPDDSWTPKTAEADDSDVGPQQHVPYAHLPPQTPGAEAALAQARAKLPQPKPEEPEGPGFMEGALRSYVGGALKGGHDEAFGELGEKFAGKGAHGLAPEAGKSLKMPDGSVRPLRSEQDVFRAVRDWERQSGKKFNQAHPVADFLLSSAGDLTSDLALSGGKKLKPLWNAVSGAATGFLGSDADLTDGKRDVGEMLKAGGSSALGGVIGGVAPELIPWGAKKVGALGGGLKNFAEKRAVKVLGRDLQGLLEGGKDAVHRLGRDLLDSKVVRAFDGLLPLGTTTEEAGERLADLAEQRGNHLGGLIDTIDDAAQPGDKLRADALVDRLRQKLLDGKANRAPAEADMRRVMKREIDQVAKLTSDPELATLSVRDAEELIKRKAQDKVNYERAINGRNQKALAKVAQAEKEAIEGHVDSLVRQRAPDLEGEFQGAKKAYGLAKQGLDITGKQEKRNLMNNMVTPTDYAAGMAGASSHGEGGGKVEAGLWALAHHLLKERGNSVTAVTADKIGDVANALRVIPGVVNKVGAPLADFAVRHLLRDYPEVADELLGTNPKEPPKTMARSEHGR